MPAEGKRGLNSRFLSQQTGQTAGVVSTGWIGGLGGTLAGTGTFATLGTAWGGLQQAGGASILATQLAAKAPPDGYTLYLATDGPFVTNPFLGFEPTAWAGVVVPKGTPQAIVDKIEADVLKVARDPQFSQKLVSVGADPLSATAAEFRQIIRTDQQKHSKLIRDLNIKGE